jgi:hypothetical protein
MSNTEDIPEDPQGSVDAEAVAEEVKRLRSEQAATEKESPAESSATTPSIDAVNDFLSGSADVVSDERPLELDEETKAVILNSKESKSEEYEEVEEPQHMPDDPIHPPEPDTWHNMLGWIITAPDVGQVEPTDYDKRLFLKALLNDVDFELEVSLDMGQEFKVKCRTLTNYELEVIFYSIERDQIEGVVRNPADYTTMLNYYSTVLQVVEVSNVPSTFPKLNGPGNKEKDSDILRAETLNYVGTFNQVRWQAIVTAMRIFTLKAQICTSKVNDVGFWPPRSTD